MRRSVRVLIAVAISGCTVVITEPKTARRPAPVVVARSGRATVARIVGVQTRADALAARVERRRNGRGARMTAREAAAFRREAQQLQKELAELERMRNDSQLSRLELQNAAQKQQQAMRTLSSVMKAVNEMSRNTVRNMK